MKKRSFILTLLVYYSIAISSAQKLTMLTNQNNLDKENSPYLKQHKNNPVNWQSWSTELIDYAKENNKLLLISIGYAACHWCHVMEEESFEDPIVAEMMNKHFVNIKIDREERPDVDQIYMEAVQAMTGQGGWPLNCIALPNGKPIWGGTYFRKKDWVKVIAEVAKVYEKQPDKVIEYGNKLCEALKEKNSSFFSEKTQIFDFKKIFERWDIYLDPVWGGQSKAPKFPLPNSVECLMRYAFQTNDKSLNEHVINTLNKMAWGGLYDHINGGFYRYAVDEKWHIPHFEKMLYDNGQMISLYAKAYQRFQDPRYKEVVFETINFVCNDLYNIKYGAFLSSLDADSLNKKNTKQEGAYYIWTKEDLKNTLNKNDYNLFKAYFNINEIGYWEDGNYHLFQTISDYEFAKTHNLSLKELASKKAFWKSTLRKKTKLRKHPDLDNKIITSWNALMLSGLVDSYEVFKNERHLNYALKNAYFIKQKLIDDSGKLYHTYTKDKAHISGFLEDYALSIEAFIKLYQVTFDEQWIQIGYELCKRVLIEFESENPMFYFTDGKDNSLFKRNIEVFDNVISSSNSIMAENLFVLGNMYQKHEWINKSKKMFNHIGSDLEKYPPSYSNWLQTALNIYGPFYEIGITGNNTNLVKENFSKLYLPNVIFNGAEYKSNIPILKNRIKYGETWIYVCQSQNCKKPTQSSIEAISNIETTLK